MVGGSARRVAGSQGVSSLGERRKDILARLPIVFGLSVDEAAAAIGVSAGTFREMVVDKRMPGPRRIGSRLVWDVDEVRAAFKALPRDGDDDSVWDNLGNGNPWDEVLTPAPKAVPRARERNPLQEHYDEIGYDPRTMAEADYRRLIAAANQKWKDSIPAMPLNKLERRALSQLREHQPNEPISSHLLKGTGPATADRLEARGYLLQSFYPDEPNRLMHYILTEAGLAAANALATE